MNECYTTEQTKPLYFDTIEDALILKNVVRHSVATARASIVYITTGDRRLSCRCGGTQAGRQAGRVGGTEQLADRSTNLSSTRWTIK
jgi:hypothetical protein